MGATGGDVTREQEAGCALRVLEGIHADFDAEWDCFWGALAECAERAIMAISDENPDAPELRRLASHCSRAAGRPPLQDVTLPRQPLFSRA